MRIQRLAPLVLAAAFGLPLSAAAQHVSADISLGGGPVSGRIIVGEPHDHYAYPGPYYRYHEHRPHYGDPVVEYYREPPQRVIIVQRHHGRKHGWWRHHGYRRVMVWYDRERNHYYDRVGRRRDGLREVTVWERDGQYYSDRRYDSGRTGYRE